MPSRTIGIVAMSSQHSSWNSEVDSSLGESDVSTCPSVQTRSAAAAAKCQPILSQLDVAKTSQDWAHVVEGLTDEEREYCIYVLDDLLAKTDPQSQLHRTRLPVLRQLCSRYDGYLDKPIVRSVSCIKSHTFKTSLGKWGGKLVRLKTTREGSHDFKVIKDLCREAMVWRHLSHPNLVPFYGVYNDNRLGLVDEWLPNGDIHRFLKNNPNANRPQLLLDIAYGLQYLHSDHVNIVHGGLKGKNVLVDENGRARLSDFAFGHITYKWYAFAPFVNLDGIRWVAPEDMDLSDNDTPTRASDVYAFSLVSLEVFTGAVPFADITDRAGQLLRHVAAGMRPQRPLEAHALGLTDNVWLTMEKCWQGVPGLRPSISQATEELEDEWLSRSSSGDNGSIQAAQSSE